MIKEAIEKVVSKQDLTYDEAYTVMNEIMNGETSQVQNAAYLAALSTKSTKAETIAEISGSAAAMRDHALRVEHDMDVMEIVGTGGDHAHSINISTTAAFIISITICLTFCLVLFAWDAPTLSALNLGRSAEKRFMSITFILPSCIEKASASCRKKV